jgi:DNA gyrase/topoisomerase IV subunit A
MSERMARSDAGSVDVMLIGGMRHHAEMDGDPELDQREHDGRLLELLDAIAAALERRSEVLAVVESSDEEEEAVRRLTELLGVSELAAVEVLNMQWRRLTRQGRAEIYERRDSLRDRR